MNPACIQPPRHIYHPMINCTLQASHFQCVVNYEAVDLFRDSKDILDISPPLDTFICYLFIIKVQVRYLHRSEGIYWQVLAYVEKEGGGAVSMEKYSESYLYISLAPGQSSEWTPNSLAYSYP